MIPYKRIAPEILRREFRKHLTEEEVVELGVDLGAGAPHYRAYVGPPFNYDINGALQFQLLSELGLREYHRFLEIGCGSLRLGRLAIPFLLPNRYFGVEPNVSIFRAGVEKNLGAPLESNQLVELKKPRFAHNDKFDFSFTGGPVDFIFAQSIASHTGLAETQALINSVAAVSHENTIAMVTYIRCGDHRKSNKKDGWFYPECVTYSYPDMIAMAGRAGLKAYNGSWPLANFREDGAFTLQQPLILTRKPWRPGLPQRLAAALVGP